MASGNVSQPRYYNQFFLPNPVTISSHSILVVDTGIPYPGEAPIIGRYFCGGVLENAFCGENGTLNLSIMNPMNNSIYVDRVWFYRYQ